LIDESVPWLNPIPREYRMASLSVKELLVDGLWTPIVFSGMILAGFDIFIKIISKMDIIHMKLS